MGGANPNKVFKAQEDFKDRNGINDDGTLHGQSIGNDQTIDVTDTAVLGENGGVPTLTIEGSGVVYTRVE